MFKEMDFEKLSNNKLIMIFCIPSIIALFLESFTSIIDTAFAGRIGIHALSGMGVLSPILSILIAMQLLFGISTGIVLSKTLGENDEKKVEDVFTSGLIMTILISVITSFLIYIFLNPILDLLGATDLVRVAAKEYLQFELVSNIFSSLGYLLVNVIRSYGYPKMEVIISILAMILNVLLNFTFTIIFNKGIKGIAFATLLSEVFGFVVAVIFLYKKNLFYKIKGFSFSKNKYIICDLFKIGFVQFFMQGIGCVIGFLANNRLLFYGNSIYLAVRALIYTIFEGLLMPLVGLSQGIQTILAYFTGSNDKKRVKDIVKKSILYSFIYGISMYFILIFKPNFFINMFSNDTKIIAITSSVIKIFFASFPILGVFYILVSLMQVCGSEKKALKITIIKQILIYSPLVIVLPWILNKFQLNYLNAIYGIFLATPVADFITLIIFFGYYLEGDFIWKKKKEDIKNT